jgi:hypothetical protein
MLAVTTSICFVHEDVAMPFFHDPEGAFWGKVDRSGGDDACWIWTRFVDTPGYGALKVWGRKVLAHRYAYELHYGSIPKGKIVCHRCNQRLCVNPRHLYIGTYKDNYDDMARSGNNYPPPGPTKEEHRARGERNGRAELTEEEVLDIYRRISSGEKVSKIATAYGINRSIVSDIKRGRSWRWLTRISSKRD